VTIDRRLIAIIVVTLSAGWWLGSSPSSPINPTPQRPVLQAVGRIARIAARLGLWMAMAAEPAPSAERQQIARSPPVDAAGNRVVDHGEGW
jgi:hypothetical protein